MNIFVLSENPCLSAQYMCDKHIPKMCVESAQMLASALLRHGATPSDMPLTKSGTPYKGGYHRHPCTVWAGDSTSNFLWLLRHAGKLCEEFTKRYGKVHSCEVPIDHMWNMIDLIKGHSHLTDFAQAMPEQYKHKCAVTAYRKYYKNEKLFASWGKGTNAPYWW